MVGSGRPLLDETRSARPRPGVGHPAPGGRRHAQGDWTPPPPAAGLAASVALALDVGTSTVLSRRMDKAAAYRARRGRHSARVGGIDAGQGLFVRVSPVIPGRASALPLCGATFFMSEFEFHFVETSKRSLSFRATLDDAGHPGEHSFNSSLKSAGTDGHDGDSGSGEGMSMDVQVNLVVRSTRVVTPEGTRAASIAVSGEAIAAVLPYDAGGPRGSQGRGRRRRRRPPRPGGHPRPRERPGPHRVGGLLDRHPRRRAGRHHDADRHAAQLPCRPPPRSSTCG